MGHYQGRNEGRQKDAIPRAPSQLWERQITAGGSEWLRGRRKVPTMSQVLL